MDLFGWLMALPIAASLLALLWLVVSGSRPALRIALLVSFAGLCVWGFFSWEFRDGIVFGPRESQGVPALQHFWARFWMPLAAWTVFVLAAMGAYRLRRAT